VKTNKHMSICVCVYTNKHTHTDIYNNTHTHTHTHTNKHTHTNLDHGRGALAKALQESWQGPRFTLHRRAQLQEERIVGHRLQRAAGCECVSVRGKECGNESQPNATNALWAQACMQSFAMS
jgi:hypothetical protein